MNKKILFGLIGAIVATSAWATDDGRILTTQTYVDNALGSKVDIAQGAGDNNANVGKTLVVNQQGNLELGTVSADNFVEDDITDGVTNKAPSENAVHDALENKQDTIATDMVDFVNDMGPLPAITTYDTTGGLVANKIGILDQETIAGDEGDLSLYHTNEYGAQMDNYVPTVRAVADGLTDIRNAIPGRLYWSNSLQTPINNYSTTFGSTSNTWPDGTKRYVPTAEAFANGLALKQNKIPAGTAGNVVTYTGTQGVVGSVATANAPTYNATTGALTNGTSIATIAAVDTKQNKIPASEWQDGTIPGVVVSTDTDGVVEQRMILDKTGNITGQSIDEMVQNGEAGQDIVDDIHDNLITEDVVNNAVPTTTMTIAIANAAVKTKQNKMTCTRWLDTPEHPEHNDDNCLLWDLGN